MSDNDLILAFGDLIERYQAAHPEMDSDDVLDVLTECLAVAFEDVNS